MEQLIEHGTVSVKLTNPEENMTDLLHLFVHMGFVAKMSEQELIDNCKRAAEDQYFQAIVTNQP